MTKKHPHIFLHEKPKTDEFTTPRKGGPQKNIKTRNRAVHSSRLRNQWDSIWSEAQKSHDSRTAVSMPAKDGVYVEFEGAPGYELVTKSLEDRRAGIRLHNIKTGGSNDDPNKQTIRATVFIPFGSQCIFLNKINQYEKLNTQIGKPRNADLIQSVEYIRLAVLESFWHDAPDLLPQGSVAEWCEIWLQDSGTDVAKRFRETADAIQIEVQAGSLIFPEKIVVLGRATQQQLTALLESSPDIAEFRRAKETAEFFLQLENKDQTEWVNEMLSRLQVTPDASVAVCILDTGANNGHALLQPVLGDHDCHTIDPKWNVKDDTGHGTLMCGVAAYGDLTDALQDRHPIRLSHCLESVKILPPRGANDPALYGDITMQAIYRAESKAPNRNRIGCMAVTSKDGRDQGRPSSWSAAIDKLTSGYDNNYKRLFIVSAGNVEQQQWSKYPESNLSNSVHDPAQSCNALTVGAYTEKAILASSDLKEHTPLAQPGELSPFSSTSCEWDKKWPIKPDIVLEGGNAARAPDGLISTHDDLSLLSTGHQPTRSQFGPINATSAAAAQAAWIAAQIQAEYPKAWPETIRGLIIHSADWPEAMKTQFMKANNRGDYSKADYGRLIRICGYGVPDLDRALACAANSLTLISETEIQPYTKKEGHSGCSTNDIHIHKLPWPDTVLLGLGEMQVTLRITLSYFIEPSPGNVGWKDKYRYASYGLRFELNKPNEDEEEFNKRLNKAARNDDDEMLNTDSGSDRWRIGSNSRDIGSVHSDIWEGNAADIATCKLIAVYPVIGWWRERAWLGRWNRKARYSLIVSLHTPDESIDIYTPVAVQLRIPVEVTV